MKITVEFNDLEEMKAFIRKFDSTEAPKEQATTPQVITPPVTQSAISAGIQPATQTVPVTPPVVSAVTAPVTPPVVPTASKTYTQDELQRAAVTLMDAGKQGEVLTLLNSFGVEAIPLIPKEQYGEFATALRQMGAQI